MTKKEILKKRLVMADHNLLCYSQSNAMNTPKPGYEKEWAAAKEESDLLLEMIDEQVSGEHGNESVNIRGTINRWYVEHSMVNKEPYVMFLKVKDRDGNMRLLEIGYDIGKDLLNRYTLERHKRYEDEQGELVIFHTDKHSLVNNWEWVD